jgi:hypothetical protein
MDGIVSTKRNALFATGGNVTINAGGNISFAKALPFDYILSSFVFNGIGAYSYENGIYKANGNAGAHVLSGLTLGALNNLSSYLNGGIAMVIGYNRILSVDDMCNTTRYINSYYGNIFL